MSKDLYRALCTEEDNSIPVFSRDWWLDAACGDDWDVLLEEKDNKVYAAMPLYVPCKYIVSMPHYTQTMGIWFAAEAADTKYSSLLGHRQAICENFIEKLRSYKSYLQNFSHEFTDWLPFYWDGYSQMTRYTYILHGIKNFEKLWLDMSQHTRRNIKKAKEESIVVRHGVTADDFLEIQALTFKRQKKKNIQSDAVLRRLINAARKRGQGEIFGGYDDAGNLHAAAFIVWQKSSAYYIAGGGDPVLRSSGAHSLVMWDAIKHVSRYTDTFDFEGSMIRGVERFFREFGAVQTPYFVITRGKPGFMDRVHMKLKNR
jgi:hypothetical protein